MYEIIIKEVNSFVCKECNDGGMLKDTKVVHYMSDSLKELRTVVLVGGKTAFSR